jgi:hypothetical protein
MAEITQRGIRQTIHVGVFSCARSPSHTFGARRRYRDPRFQETGRFCVSVAFLSFRGCRHTHSLSEPTIIPCSSATQRPFPVVCRRGRPIRCERILYSELRLGRPGDDTTKFGPGDGNTSASSTSSHHTRLLEALGSAHISSTCLHRFQVRVRNGDGVVTPSRCLVQRVFAYVEHLLRVPLR